MRSPVAPEVELEAVTLDRGPCAWRCPKTGGIWVRAADYHDWLDGRDGYQSEIFPPAENEPSAVAAIDDSLADSPAGKRCGEDGAFLIRQPVGHGLSFHVDRCGKCGGVWLDAGEWETLKQHDLHESLTRIFTAAWQEQIRRERHDSAVDEALQSKLGDADYARLREVEVWLRTHPHRHAILARLGGG